MEVAEDFTTAETNVLDIYITDRNYLSYLTVRNNQPQISYKKLGSENLLGSYRLKTGGITNPEFVNGGFRHIIGANQELMQTAVVEVDFLQIDHLGSTVIAENGPKHDYQVMVEFETWIMMQVYPKCRTLFELFGTYPGYYVFSSNLAYFVYGQNWTILPQVSVENNQIYDLGVKSNSTGTEN